ncbi:MAG: serine hydrolase domain-containing protein [Pseudomonadota bacterium]
MKKCVLISAIACLCAVDAFASPADAVLESRLRAAAAILDAQLSRESVPGAAFGIVRDQELVWTHNFGVESLDTESPVTSDSLFSICSISKLFNGVAVMDLVEAGKIDLDAPLAGYIGGLELADTTGSEEPVTVRGVLTHASGLPREGKRDYWADNSFPDDVGIATAIDTQSRLYRSYDYWQYSNLGMAMLGRAVATVSGKPWGEYVTNNVLIPLGMSRTTTDMPFDQVGSGFARGYYIRNAKGDRKPVDEHAFRAFAPAAGVASSVNDMAKFAAWHFRLQANGGEEVLRAATQKTMLRVHWMGADFEPPAWGLAYAARRYGKQTLWGHGGYCPGSSAEFVVRLPAKIGIVGMVTANDVSPGATVQWLYDLTAPLFEALAEESGDSSNDEPSDSPDFSDYEGYYVVENYDWDVYVALGRHGLNVFNVFTDDPNASMATFVHEEGDVFRRRRDNGDLAEAVTFERDSDGNVVSFVQHSYRSTKRR